MRQTAYQYVVQKSIDTVPALCTLQGNVSDLLSYSGILSFTFFMLDQFTSQFVRVSRCCEETNTKMDVHKVSFKRFNLLNFKPKTIHCETIGLFLKIYILIKRFKFEINLHL